MFSSIWLKVTGVLSVALVAMLCLIGYKNEKIEELEEEKVIEEKKSTIVRAMQEQQRLAEIKESEAQININDSDWKNGI